MSSHPSSSSVRYASATVLKWTPRSSASRRTGGNESPGFNWPLTSRMRVASTIWRYTGTGDLRSIRKIIIVLCTYTVYNDVMKNAMLFFQLLLAGAVLAAEPVRLDTGTGVLYGTLEVPASQPPFPVVLMIAGSGPTDRDGNSSMFQGKNDSLKMLAEDLAARGIASLRSDKRLIGESKITGFKEEDLRFDTYVDDMVRWGE